MWSLICIFVQEGGGDPMGFGGRGRGRGRGMMRGGFPPRGRGRGGFDRPGCGPGYPSQEYGGQHQVNLKFFA